MNTKILNFFMENLKDTFNLPKYADIRIDESIDYLQLPWTPAKRDKFERLVKNTFDLDVTFKGTIANIINDIDTRYLHWFFGTVWKPRTDEYGFTGWNVIDEINQYNPKSVLDVGCGYNQFKGKINNLIGIDPFNTAADYMVDIREYDVDDRYDAIMVFGSINFNAYEDIDVRVAQVAKLLAAGGRIYFRANPGVQHIKDNGAPYNGPWIDVFPWSFEYAKHFAEKYKLELESFKKDNHSRLFFVMKKP
jgi:SAM-dependent methyltransferase